jgi:lipopolysaccharide transport system permease protein
MAMLQHLKTIWIYRHFWLSLVVSDLKLRYRRSVLGVGWSLLHPILTTVVFCLIFSEWQEHPDWRGFAPYFLCGLAIWQYVTGSILGGCGTFFRNEQYIRQCSLPLTIYTIRTVLGTTIHFMIAMALVLTTITVLEPTAEYRALSIFWRIAPSLVLLFFFCWSLSVLSAFATVHFHDIQHLLEVSLHIMFFLTPIMYPIKLLRDKNFYWLTDGNPVVNFFELIREPLLSGIPPDPALYVRASVIVLCLMVTAVSTVSIFERKLIFRL